MDLLQIDLLLALRPAGQFGITAESLLGDMRRGRHRELTLPQLEIALRGLADLRHATPFTTALRQPRWRITAHGTSALVEEGL